MKFEIEQIEMVRKHKSEDKIDVQLKKEGMQEKWEKNDKEHENGKIVIKVKDEVSRYISPEL